MQVVPAFLERVFLHMRSCNRITGENLDSVLTVDFSNNKKEKCTYFCPSVNVTVDVNNRQNIEVQLVQKCGHDSIFSIGLHSLLGEK